MTDPDSESDVGYEDQQLRQWAKEQKLHVNQSTGDMELISTNTKKGKSDTIQEDDGTLPEINNKLDETQNCCCCCTYPKGIFCWKISLVLYNLLTSGIFIFLLSITYSPDQSLMAYAIIQCILRSCMNIIGYRMDKCLFLFIVSALSFTIVFDIVFLVYINWILSVVASMQSGMGIVFIINIIWIIDIFIVRMGIYKSLRFRNFKFVQEYEQNKLPFWVIIFLSLIMCVWGIINISSALSGDTVISVQEDGYSIEYYVGYDTIPADTTHTLQMQGVYYNGSYIVYVCTNDGLYALIDLNNDQRNDEIHQLIPLFGDKTCTSIAIDLYEDIFYITEYEKTYKCVSIEPYIDIHEQVLLENNIDENTQCSLWFEQEDYTFHSWHFTNYNQRINKLCMSMGVDCNLCEPEYPQGNILCFNNMDNPSFDNSTIYAKGIRDSVGFVFDQNGNMFFTDHNTDTYGDNKPDGELNIAWYDDIVTNNTKHFGYPYCHTVGSGDPFKRDAGVYQEYIDPTYGSDNCDEYEFPVQPLGPHVAPNGLLLTTDSEKNRVIFVAEHGSWNRADYIGYRVVKIVLDDNDKVIEHSLFVDGWLNEDKQLFSGRPTHLALLDDGSILISDDVANTIYRVFIDENEISIEQELIGGHILKIMNWISKHWSIEPNREDSN